MYQETIHSVRLPSLTNDCVTLEVTYRVISDKHVPAIAVFVKIFMAISGKQ
jgi:hypothetical protein